MKKDITEAKQVELTGKQQIFCHEYLKDYNATQAAIRSGYSERSAYSIAHDLLRKPEIRRFINELSSEKFQEIGLSKQRITYELMQIAFNERETSPSRVKALVILMEMLEKKLDSQLGSNRLIQGAAILERLKKLRGNN